MNEHEERTCQAERDYDFQREEELLTHTADEQYDVSQCHDFMDRVLRYSTNDVLKHMQGLIIDEMNARPQEKCQGEISLDAFMKEAYEIEDMKKEVF